MAIIWVVGFRHCRVGSSPTVFGLIHVFEELHCCLQGLDGLYSARIQEGMYWSHAVRHWPDLLRIDVWHEA